MEATRTARLVGRGVILPDAARAVAAAWLVPVYGTHSTYLGGGITGGRLLRGETPFSIPLLLGRPNWWQILAVVAAAAVEAAILVALLVERRQRRRAEEEARHRRRELAEAARLATVGELAASISHEINQPLGAILANAEAAEMLLASSNGHSDEIRQILLDIRRDDLRASEVIQRVKRLAGRREVEMKPLDLNAVVESVVRLLVHQARQHGVTLEEDLGRGIPAALGDEVALQQVIINLAMNGMEAMAEVPVERRRLLIRTSVSRDRVSVRVSDAGPGIAAADRHNLFRSFFTTKAQGVGLGLSICRSIVEAHCGTIEAAHEPAGGTAFEFTLPVCAGRAPPAISVGTA